MTDPELFGRKATVIVDTLQLDGLRVVFGVTKSLKSEPNTCSVTVYNLSPDHRAQLEELKPKKGATRGIPVKIEAGYKAGTSLIWLGDLRTVDSVRDGADWITQLSSGDGEKGIQNGRIAVSYGPKTDSTIALRAIVRSLGVDEGNIGKVVAELKLRGKGELFASGKVLAGPAARMMDDFCRSADLEWSVQDGAVQLLDRGKALAAKAILLTPDSGMVGSPTVNQDGVLSARMLMAPDVRPGRLLVVKSARITGNYRIETAKWSGDTEGGDWFIDLEAKRY